MSNNSSNKARTPKWAIRYGLVNNADRERKARKSQWAKRYDERLPESTFVGQELAEGEEGPNYVPTVPGQQKRRPSEGLWDREDEIYYNEGESCARRSWVDWRAKADISDEAPNQSNWHYPMNFEGTVGDGRSRRNRLNRTASRGSDRWERTRTARADTVGSQDSYGSYPPKAATDDDVPVWGKDYGRQRRSSRGSGSSGGRRNDPDAVFNHEF